MDKDREQDRKNRFAWVAAAMPLVPARIKALRQEHGDAHVNECWKRGVIAGEPGWFFARQGSVAIGAPFVGKEGAADWGGMQLQPDQVVVLIKPPAAKGSHGAH